MKGEMKILNLVEDSKNQNRKFMYKTNRND